MGVTIVYETHSTTVDNEIGIATGWLPGELSERGRVEAVELGVRRRDVDMVYASDLRRAVQTVEIAFQSGEGLPGAEEVRLDRRLRECDYGIYNGRPVSELTPLRGRYVEVPWPGGQSYRQVVAETAAFLEDAVREWRGREGRVLVVAHSANRWALEHLVHGASLEELVVGPFGWRPGWEFRLG